MVIDFVLIEKDRKYIVLDILILVYRIYYM